MKRRYLRIRFERGATAQASRVVLLRSGLDITHRVPVNYWPAMKGAEVGAKIQASLFYWPMRVVGRTRPLPCASRTASRRYRARRIVREHVVLRVAELAEVAS
jgi:hypothetical protein